VGGVFGGGTCSNSAGWACHVPSPIAGILAPVLSM